MTRKDSIIIAQMVAELICHKKLDPNDEKTRDIIDSWLGASNFNYNSTKFWNKVGKELGIEIELN